MIVGIGTDIVEHETTKKLNWETNPKILSRIFSTKEIEIYNLKKNIRFLCGRFAAKEAILKCLGTGMRDGYPLTDIQILESDLGKPIIELIGKTKDLSNKMGVTQWHISISHANEFSLAFAIAEHN